MQVVKLIFLDLISILISLIWSKTYVYTFEGTNFQARFKPTLQFKRIFWLTARFVKIMRINQAFLKQKSQLRDYEYICLFVVGQILPKKYFLNPSFYFASKMWSLVTLESKKMSLLLTFWSNNKNIVSVNFVFKSILKIDENNWYIVQKVGGEPLKSIQFQ